MYTVIHAQMLFTAAVKCLVNALTILYDLQIVEAKTMFGQERKEKGRGSANGEGLFQWLQGMEIRVTILMNNEEMCVITTAVKYV